MTSRIARWNLPAVALANPASPSPAVSTSYPSAVSKSETVSTSPGSSSTNSMRKLILKLRRRGGNAHHELSSFHRLAMYANRAAVRLHDLFHQIQPEACAVHLILHSSAAAEE